MTYHKYNKNLCVLKVNLLHKLPKYYNRTTGGIMKKSLIFAIASGTLAAVLAFSGCAQKESKELNIYSALPETELPMYFEAFKNETGITVNFVRLSAGEIFSKLKVEKNNPQASIWHGGNCDTFIAASKAGLLEPYASPELKNTPDRYKDPDNYWSPIYIGALSFVVDKNWFAERNLAYPASWNDLLKDEFRGEISMAHPGTSGAAYTILATVVQLMGEDQAFEYFKKLNNNIRQYTKAGAAPAKNVALGEAAIGIGFSHDNLKPAGEGYPVALSFPQEGTGYEIGGVALIKNGPAAERKNAEKFIDWCLSKSAQDVYSKNNSYRLPVNTLSAAPPEAVSISELKVIDYDFIWAGDNRTRLIEKFTEVIASKDNLK